MIGRKYQTGNGILRQLGAIGGATNAQNVGSANDPLYPVIHWPRDLLGGRPRYVAAVYLAGRKIRLPVPQLWKMVG